MERQAVVNRVLLLVGVLLFGTVAPLVTLPAFAEAETDTALTGAGYTKYPLSELSVDESILTLKEITSRTQHELTRDVYSELKSHNADYQRIFPPDERIRVSPTTHYPASAIARIERYTFGVYEGHCSGTFIGPNVVLTAAHCLYTPQTGWGSDLRVIPAQDGQLEPFGSQFAANWWVPDEWYFYGEFGLADEWDWGLVGRLS